MSVYSSIEASAIPTGGAALVQYVVSGAFTLSRAVSGMPYTQLASGFVQFTTNENPLIFIDIGDGLPGPLDPTAFYLYQLSDANGVLTSEPVQPASTVVLDIEPLTGILIRLFQGALNASVLPPGIVTPGKITLAMPVNSFLPLPIITLNLDLLQQEGVPIGQSFPHVNQLDGSFVIFGQAKRIYTISILAADGLTRDFFREALVRWWLAIITFALQPIGQSTSHRYQVASGQVAKDADGKAPGFYYADLMIELNGSFNVSISQNFGLIEKIDVTVNYPDGVVDEIIVV